MIPMLIQEQKFDIELEDGHPRSRNKGKSWYVLISCLFLVILNVKFDWLYFLFQNDSFRILDASSVGQQGFKETLAKRIIVWENRDLGEPGPKLPAPRPRRSGPGKNNFSLLVNWLFVTIFCFLRSWIGSIPGQIKEMVRKLNYLCHIGSTHTHRQGLRHCGRWLKGGALRLSITVTAVQGEKPGRREQGHCWGQRRREEATTVFYGTEFTLRRNPR